MRRLHIVVLALLAALVWTSAASARGGNYVFDGGTPKQQAQVRVALEASSFNWSLVPARIVIHLGKGTDTYAKKGEIWIDTNLLNSGPFAWGPIQHEYAHQVDFFLLDDAKRSRLIGQLGGKAWADRADSLGFHRPGHTELGAERFASTLAYAYWEAPENSLKPRSVHDEAAAMDPAQFRDLLSKLIAAPNPTPRVVVVK